MNYEEIGFKSGIEIHQQLETRKLFCNCPSIVHDKNPDIKVVRKLRAVAGETGKIDAAAKHEKKKDRSFIYEACSTSSCLVELDEEPPHEVNQEALEIGLQVANLFNAKIVDEIVFMRKTVVDGSNTSGFQRTALIAVDGFIETSLGKVGVPLICLEEEAAKKIKEDNESVTFRLDRLGVPLLEIATDPDIKNPEHAKECAEKIGMILRSTGKVKRGIGTIRQDVNISIKGGARTEIKGFQDLKSIPKVIDNEIKRQQNLINKGEKIEMTVRKAEPDFSTSFLRPMPGSARMYPETDVKTIKPSDVKVEEVEMIEDKAERYEKLGIGKDLAIKLAKSEMNDVFDSLNLKNIKPAFIAETLISAPREIRRKQNIEIQLSNEQYKEIFNLLDSGKIPKDSILEVLVAFQKGTFNIEDYKGIDNSELEKEIKKIIDSNKGKPFGALMGMVMQKFNGKADGKTVSEILKKNIKN